MTARDSSSSATGRPEASSGEQAVDLVAAGLLPALPRAFLAGRDRDLLSPLRFAEDADDLPEEPPEVDREALAEGLAEANAAYGHPRAAELAERLADPAVRVVVTGQQPGLLGGPLYTLSKAVAAARLAEELSAGRGGEAVAVFWIATEDHDWAETSRIALPAPGGLLELDLGDDPAPLLPLGMRTLGPRVEEVLDEIGEAMPGDRYAGWLDRLRHWYRPDARFGEAFARLMTGMLGERCPLLLDAMLPAVKEAERPWLERLVERREAVAAALERADRAVDARGYELQVSPQPGMSPLFLLQGRERRRIGWCDDRRFSLRGDDGCEHPVERLAETVAENPGAVSPGVQARPVVQDAILGTSLQVLGPGEMSYMPQASLLYEALGVAAPAVALRPQALVLEEHQLDKLAELELSLAELVAPDLDLDARLAGASDGGGFVDDAREAIAGSLETLRDEALELDPNLESPWQKTRDNVLRALDAFGGKVTGALARQNEVARQRARALRAACRPRGALQERVIASAHFPGKYGDRFVDRMWEQLGSDPRSLRVVKP